MEEDDGGCISVGGLAAEVGFTPKNPHHWSGWPGAYCMHCGCEDPREVVLGGGLPTGTVESIKGECPMKHPVKGCPQCNPNPDRRTADEVREQERAHMSKPLLRLQSIADNIGGILEEKDVRLTVEGGRVALTCAETGVRYALFGWIGDHWPNNLSKPPEETPS